MSSTLAVPTTEVTAHLVLRTLSSRSIAEIFRSALRAGKDAANKVQLQEVFVSLVGDLYEEIAVILCEVVSHNDASFLLRHQPFSLSDLIDDVVSVVYSQKPLNDAYQIFVAQVRETRISSVVDQPKSTQPLHIHNDRGGNLLSNGCSYRWLLEPTSVQVLDTATRDVLSNMTLASIAQFVREFSCIDLDIKQKAASLSLQSVFILPHQVSPMTLVLDGRHRVFRVLPSGLSSMIKTLEGWCIGDYVGCLSDDGQSVDVDFFAYKGAADTPLDTRVKVSSTSDCSTDDRTAVARRISLSITLEEKQGNTYSSTHLAGDCYPSNIFAFVDGVVSGPTHRQELAGNFKLSEMTSAERGELWDTLDWMSLMEIRAGYVAIC
ncbi:Hypothetical protein PHPALM_20683 [Phytophthora palmivora]|uniref:Uncharacterized protein n=1 Tax=Phytophthora palmivora TaxID=4796 RepID=A0A2P4XE91_9STRA|nr:Hypothetical protein PHPALM_20683 [Phytophthora palmivora]